MTATDQVLSTEDVQELNEMWSQFKNTHNKEYRDEDEEVYRFEWI